MNGLLSVWQQVGSNWVLVGANDNAPFGLTNVTTGLTPDLNAYFVPVHQYIPANPTTTPPSPAGGISDPGLTLNLTGGSTYLILQSDYLNGPTSLSNDVHLTGALGQTIAIGSNLQAALWNSFFPIGDPAFSVNNIYDLTVTGNVVTTTAPAAVPVPAALWLFGSALAGLGVVGRKKESRMAA
ncbi:MAG: VPLPA-CTERM sorting domain-containing protein [Methylococcaceae bacterium]|nr:VPLPA-CTERM sorting domain-containing protein [Methylococcaceae bacterium]